MKSHIADKHKHMDQYICTDCRLGFRHKHSQDDHIAKKHGLVKCSTCAKKKFKNEKRLKHYFNSKHCGDLEGEKKRIYSHDECGGVTARLQTNKKKLESFENMCLTIG